MTPDPRMLQGRRKLDTDDYRMMDLPEHLWGARFADIPTPISATVQNYLVRICELLNVGRGMLLSGPRHSGKSRTAAVVAKEAMRRGGSVYWTRVSDLRRDLKARRTLPINDGTFVLDRCYEVGLLVLDDLRADDAKDYALSVRDIEDLVTGRASRHRATIITTALTLPQLERVFHDFILATGSFLRTLSLTEGDAPSATPTPDPVPPTALPEPVPEGVSPPDTRRINAERLMDEDD